MRFSPPLQVLERGPGGEVSESPVSIPHCLAVEDFLNQKGQPYPAAPM